MAAGAGADEDFAPPDRKRDREDAPEEREAKSAHVKGSRDMIDEAFMTAAAMSALAGVRIGHGGPFGASIVRDGVIVACAHNMVLHRRDPCCHAEMNAISQACRALGSHDLSDCDLYTTCEPCPMCWGAVQWSQLNKAYVGVNRFTAAKYGFDDKVFYDEVDTHSGHSYGIRRTGFVCDTTAEFGPDRTFKRQVSSRTQERVDKGMVRVYDGILEEECNKLFTDPKINKTLKRRFDTPTGEKMRKMHSDIFVEDPNRSRSEVPTGSGDQDAMGVHEKNMRRAIGVAQRGVCEGRSKGREPFAALVVKDGVVVAESCNTVLQDRDATASAEVNAIRVATQRLGTHNLGGCDMYCTAHPDLMSLGAILWARIDNVYCGVTQTVAAQSGFEEGILHFKDLLEADDYGKRITEVVEGVAAGTCEKVFQEWSERNGVVY